MGRTPTWCPTSARLVLGRDLLILTRYVVALACSDPGKPLLDAVHLVIATARMIELGVLGDGAHEQTLAHGIIAIPPCLHRPTFTRLRAINPEVIGITGKALQRCLELAIALVRSTACQ